MFLQAFVGCGWGISNIGFVMICFGVCNAIASIFTGGITKITGRSPVVAFALALHVALLVTLLVWHPSTHNKITYFVMAGLWGIVDAVWLVQINCKYLLVKLKTHPRNYVQRHLQCEILTNPNFSALSGILFPGREEAAYSNFRLWESTGSVITYAYNPYLCTDVKLYLLLGLLLVGVSGYTAIEYLEMKKENSELSSKEMFDLVKGKKKNSGEVAN